MYISVRVCIKFNYILYNIHFAHVPLLLFLFIDSFYYLCSDAAWSKIINSFFFSCYLLPSLSLSAFFSRFLLLVPLFPAVLI